MTERKKNIFHKLRTLVTKLPALKLSHRTTLSFFLFGILIGYISFAVFIMITTRSYIDLASEKIMQHFEKVYSSPRNDILLQMIRNPIEKILKDITRIKNAASEFHEIQKACIIYHPHNKNKWIRLFESSRHVDSTDEIPVTSKKETYDLNQASRQKISTSAPFFFGKSDKITIYINITRQIDINKYILAITVSRQGILSMLRSHIYQFSLFSGAIFLCSILLGKIFARFLTKPIESLSEASSRIAEGDFSHRFRLPRRDEIGILAGSLDSMAENLETHISEIERRMHAMETMNQIDKTVLSSISRADLLERVVTIVSSFFSQTSIIMPLYNKGKEGYDVLTFNDNDLNHILGEKRNVPESDLPPELAAMIRTTVQISADHFEKALPFQSLADTGIRFLLNVPIHIAEEYLGSLVLAGRSRAPFSDSEIETAEMIADQVGVALDSVRTFEEKEKLLIGILMALTSAIDAKSRWTAGHSERVARYAEDLASRLGLPEGEVRDITISAILHDIGKISVPETILDKPERLTPDEYDVIKGHPEKGSEIIEKISAYDRMLPGILYHHEHWDGGGYPFGLRGRQIPLMSRIITLADVYDAVTDERPYRKGLSGDEAIKFLKENREKLFDPELVDLFIEILKEKNQEK